MSSAAPLPDLARIRPRLSMLSTQDCLQIHQASCSILKQTGVRVFSEEGLDLLKTAGAQIEKDLVKISPVPGGMGPGSSSKQLQAACTRLR